MLTAWFDLLLMLTVHQSQTYYTATAKARDWSTAAVVPLLLAVVQIYTQYCAHVGLAANLNGCH